ncbi:hypothetical protein EJB05_05250, partial [Eragrostis curvula]
MWVLPLDFGIALLFEPFLSPLHFELVALLRLGFGAVTRGDLPAIFRSEEMSIGFSSNEDPDLFVPYVVTFRLEFKMQYCSVDLPYCFVLVPHSIAAWTGSGQGSQYQQSSSGKAHVFGREELMQLNSFAQLLNLARAAAVMKESMLSLMIEVILLPRASVYEVLGLRIQVLEPNPAPEFLATKFGCSELPQHPGAGQAQKHPGSRSEDWDPPFTHSQLAKPFFIYTQSLFTLHLLHLQKMSLLVRHPIPSPAANIRGFRRVQRAADGPASLLGIGTANPPNCVLQEDYPDYYFRVTKSEHLTDLKAKLKRICHKSAIKKRYFHHDEALQDAHPEFLDCAAPTLDARLDILEGAVPELTAAAAAKGHRRVGPAGVGHHPPRRRHLLGVPHARRRPPPRLAARPPPLRSPHHALHERLRQRLRRTPRRQGRRRERARRARARGLRRAHARHAPRAQRGARRHARHAVHVRRRRGRRRRRRRPNRGGNAGVRDGLRVADRDTGDGAEHLAAGRLREDGLLFDPSREMPALVRDNIERCVADALAPIDVSGGGWNDLFWAVHPGGRAVLDSVEAGLRLEPGKLAASRRVLSEFGNLSGPAVIFVLDELLRRQEKCPMGVMLGLGPGVSVETMVLRSTGSHKKN